MTLALKGLWDKARGGGRLRIDFGVEGDLKLRGEESPARNKDFADMMVVKIRKWVFWWVGKF